MILSLNTARSVATGQVLNLFLAYHIKVAGDSMLQR